VLIGPREIAELLERRRDCRIIAKAGGDCARLRVIRIVEITEAQRGSAVPLQQYLDLIAKLDGGEAHAGGFSRIALTPSIYCCGFNAERGASAQALAALGIPALLFNETSKVLAANPLIEALTGFVRWRAFDRVSLNDKGADQLLGDAVATIGSETRPQAPPVELVQSLFDLTPAEANVACSLASGKLVEATATEAKSL
jgi:hypothetical protein